MLAAIRTVDHGQTARADASLHIAAGDVPRDQERRNCADRRGGKHQQCASDEAEERFAGE